MPAAILDNAATWKINAKLEIKELVTQEEADEEHEEAPADTKLEDMSKPQLVAIATKEGVEFKPTDKKEKILAAIQAKRG